MVSTYNDDFSVTWADPADAGSHGFAIAFSRATAAFAVIRRHYRLIVATGGGILIATGVMILTGAFTELNVWAQRVTSELGLNL